MPYIVKYTLSIVHQTIIIGVRRTTQDHLHALFLVRMSLQAYPQGCLPVSSLLPEKIMKLPAVAARACVSPCSPALRLLRYCTGIGLIALILANFEVSGALCTWNGAAGDSLWSSSGNWYQSRIPGPTDTVVVTGTDVCRLDTDIAVASFLLTDFSGIFVVNGYTVRITGTGMFNTRGIINDAPVNGRSGRLVLAGSRNQELIPSAKSSGFFRQIVQAGKGTVILTENALYTDTVAITNGTLDLGEGLVHEVGVLMMQGRSGTLDFSTSTLRYYGARFDASEAGSIRTGSGQLELCGKNRQTLVSRKGLMLPALVQSGKYGTVCTGVIAAGPVTVFRGMLDFTGCVAAIASIAGNPLGTEDSVRFSKNGASLIQAAGDIDLSACAVTGSPRLFLDGSLCQAVRVPHGTVCSKIVVDAACVHLDTSIAGIDTLLMRKGIVALADSCDQVLTVNRIKTTTGSIALPYGRNAQLRFTGDTADCAGLSFTAEERMTLVLDGPAVQVFIPPRAAGVSVIRKAGKGRCVIRGNTLIADSIIADSGLLQLGAGARSNGTAAGMVIGSLSMSAVVVVPKGGTVALDAPRITFAAGLMVVAPGTGVDGSMDCSKSNADVVVHGSLHINGDTIGAPVLYMGTGQWRVSGAVHSTRTNAEGSRLVLTGDSIQSFESAGVQGDIVHSGKGRMVLRSDLHCRSFRLACGVLDMGQYALSATGSIVVAGDTSIALLATSAISFEAKDTIRLEGSAARFLAVGSPALYCTLSAGRCVQTQYCILRNAHAAGATALNCIDSGANSGWVFKNEPAAPGILGAVVGKGSVTVVWRRGRDTDLLRYRVASTQPFVDSTVSAMDTTWTFSGLQNSVQYRFRIQAIDSAGFSGPWSSDVSVLACDGSDTCDGSSASDVVQIWQTGGRLVFSPEIVSFGVSTTDKGRSLTTTIRNTGKDTLRIDTVIVIGRGRFSVEKARTSWCGAILAPGKFRTDTIRYQPNSQGSDSLYIVAISNSVSSPDTLRLKGSSNALTKTKTQGIVPEAFSFTETPVSGGTVLFRYDIPVASRVVLEIYNAIGRTMERPVDRFSTTGAYQLLWDVSHLSRGVYFCRIRAEAIRQDEILYAKTTRLVFFQK